MTTVDNSDQERSAVKIIGLEEHFVTSDVLAAWRELDPKWQDVALKQSDRGDVERRLIDLAAERLASMDETGLDVQVLSLTAPGVQSLESGKAAALQTASNDLLAEAIRRRPDRFQGLATLATPDPNAAARELERAVTRLHLNGAMLFGRTRDRNLDHPANWAIFEAAAALRAPLYLHPQSPTPAVREAIYGGFGEPLDGALSTFGLGWHYETGVQLLRLVLSGVFDRFPDLQIVTGHWGEVVLFYLDRIDELTKPAKLERPVSHYFHRHVSITPGGIWSERYLRWAIEVLGIERILFSTDYPYRFTPDGGARRYLVEANLSDAEKDAIAHGNWDRLVDGIRR
ncbi:amidohydrolase family protein [Beijerinckia sp. L45]|uniref:amidohydrolase family protein n=1 Tax=Beijerinckia sp. L45 TaxID=1641855 RepID=UPI001FEE85DB|nr:amidohydrolase family protein [Beijerinckia sp. L45]